MDVAFGTGAMAMLRSGAHRSKPRGDRTVYDAMSISSLQHKAVLALNSIVCAPIPD